tara:strand:- start:6967 stop:7869 length:903 start_codon:yes stop_codon:yes gene_type:complete
LQQEVNPLTDYFYQYDATIMGILADRGVGKSALMTAIAHEEFVRANNSGTKAGKAFKIYHNNFLLEDWSGWHVDGVKTDRVVSFGLEDILHTVDSGESKIRNGLILIDEISSIQDNRYSSASIGGILFSHFIIMIRKQGCSIIWTGQRENTIDQRLKSQCDVIAYPVTSKQDKGKGIVGCTYVYQNGTFTYAGNRKKMMYWDLKPYFKAYDTMRIIKSESMSKNDLYEKKLEIQQDEIFDKILDNLEKRQKTKISTMEVKKLIEKELNIVWDLKRVEENLKLMATPTVKNKSLFDFSIYA